MTVIANNVFVDNDSLMYGSGDVTITRPNLSATGDSAFIDQGRRNNAPHAKAARSKGRRTTRSRCTGTSSTCSPRTEVAAGARPAERDGGERFDDAQVGHHRPSRTQRLTRSRLRVERRRQRQSRGRAQVISPTQNLTADSLDVSCPARRIQLVRAVRDAHREAQPDTTHFRPANPTRSTGSRGDTIVAHFDTVAASDTSKRPAIKQLVAIRSCELVVPHGAQRHGRAAPGNQSRRRAPHHDRLRSTQVATVTTVDSVRASISSRKPTAPARSARADSTKTNGPAKARDRKPIAKPPTRRQAVHRCSPRQTRPRSQPISLNPQHERRTRPARVRAMVDRLARGDRSTALALHALISVGRRDRRRGLRSRRQGLPRRLPERAPRLGARRGARSWAD